MPDSCSPLLRDWPTLCRCQGPQMSAGNYRSCWRSGEAFSQPRKKSGRHPPPPPLGRWGELDGRNKRPTPSWVPTPPASGPFTVPAGALAPSFLQLPPHPGLLLPLTTVWMPISTLSLHFHLGHLSAVQCPCCWDAPELAGAELGGGVHPSLGGWDSTP